MVENTSTRPRAAHLLGMIGEGQSDYIENMEAAGQRQLVESDLLPSDGPWSDLEALGAVAGDVVEGDDLFRHVTFTNGWRDEALMELVAEVRSLEDLDTTHVGSTGVAATEEALGDH